MRTEKSIRVPIRAVSTQNPTKSQDGQHEYAKRLVEGQAAGDALFNAKTSMSPGSDTRLMNYYDFNLDGDPSLALATCINGKATSLAATGDDSGVSLAWDAPAEGASVGPTYEVYRAGGGCGGSFSLLDSTASTAYDDLTAVFGTKYGYRISSFS